MRFLFYTATVAFLALAGIFTFFALQPPKQDGAPRVVLSIDSGYRSAIPANTSGNEQPSLPASVADASPDEAAETVPNSAGDAPVIAEQSSDGAEILTPTGSSASSDQHLATENATVAETLTEQDKALSEPGSEPPAEFPSLLPGTALTNLEEEPHSRETKPSVERTQTPASANGLPGADLALRDEPAASAEKSDGSLATPSQPDANDIGRIASLHQENANENPETSASQEPPAPVETIKSEQLGAPEQSIKSDHDQKLKAEFDAFLASKEQQTTDASPVAAVATEFAPPLPPQRPSNIPAPVKTAANTWAGQQFSLTDAPSTSSPRVAIVLRGLGRDHRNSEDAVTKLPSAVSMAFMPYNGPSQQWSRKARELGHEVIIQLPLEPANYPNNNPGPETLLASSGADENIARLRSILSRFDNYNGVTNFLGGRLLQSPDALRPILETLKSQGLIYVGEANNSHLVVRRLAGEIGLRYGGADIVIDSRPTPDAIKKALDGLVVLARKKGSAIGIGYASQTTIEQVEAWSKTVSGSGVTLVPVGALAQAPGAS
jgi:polysaccharide deacetylase 2 family uncharacterized protein YibQ